MSFPGIFLLKKPWNKWYQKSWKPFYYPKRQCSIWQSNPSESSLATGDRDTQKTTKSSAKRIAKYSNNKNLNIIILPL